MVAVEAMACGRPVIAFAGGGALDTVLPGLSGERFTVQNTDALLATCGAGDIGDHFPPSDPQWKGAASRIFLEHAAGIVRARGGTIMNADVSLIAEAPKIGPHREEMRRNLSEFLGISIDRCSVKATTNEQIGFVGRREGIAAIATATVVYKGTDA